MLRVIVLLFICTSSSAALKVMTFNTWMSGGEVNDGIAKLANHIRLVDPDVVALQEVETPYVVPNITALLGSRWQGAHHCNVVEPDTGIITKHTIVPGSYQQVSRGFSVQIQLDSGKQIAFWSLHLEYLSYGPYAANNKQVTTPDQIMAGEYPSTSDGRVQNIVELVNSEAFIAQVRNSNSVPLIVAGDFNAPSHLDWIKDNARIHGDWVFAWPSTLILSTASNMIDSFRQLYPDPVANPGYSWSTVNKFNSQWDYTIPEPQDRLDFIFYRGPLKPVSSGPYAGNGTLTPIPHQWNNDYPSDHYAYVTTFEETASSNEPVEMQPIDPQFLVRPPRHQTIQADFCDMQIYYGSAQN